MATTDLDQLVLGHYEQHWGRRWTAHRWSRDPHSSLPPMRPEFCVLEFPETEGQHWRYATCSMSAPQDEARIELFLYAPRQNAELVEMLTIVAHYHITGRTLGLHHTVNFGRPRLPGSRCDFGFISWPHIEVSTFATRETEKPVLQFLWLIPVTKEEVEYKKQAGVESLEDRFEDSLLNYVDPFRQSVA